MYIQMMILEALKVTRFIIKEEEDIEGGAPLLTVFLYNLHESLANHFSNITVTNAH